MGLVHQDLPKCYFCGSKFNCISDLNFHFAFFHKDQYESYSKCEKCPKKFATKNQLVQHIFQIHGNLEFNFCRICHVILLLDEDKRIESHSCSRCEKCGKKFATKNQLVLHIFQIHGNQEFNFCQICHNFLLLDEDGQIEWHSC